MIPAPRRSAPRDLTVDKSYLRRSQTKSKVQAISGTSLAVWERRVEVILRVAPGVAFWLSPPTSVKTPKVLCNCGTTAVQTVSCRLGKDPRSPRSCLLPLVHTGKTFGLPWEVTKLLIEQLHVF
ncbi:unnamed protein product [Pleuronectes platessa]|uniref:Uncharacterized protein n=1 Tax=Pleuronectes platessa TaxID=8262 RepID=A0A9N7ZCE5_PLEPL|nr:unnamed protein product [Pleuronectes platessa]